MHNEKAEDMMEHEPNRTYEWYENREGERNEKGGGLLAAGCWGSGGLGSGFWVSGLWVWGNPRYDSYDEVFG